MISMIPRSRYARLICLAVLLSIIINTLVLIFSAPIVVWGDAYFFHYSANLIADGQGWINPIRYLVWGEHAQAADHPPVYLIYLALYSFVGLDSVGAHQIATVIIGVVAVPLFAVVGTKLAGRQVGLVAAFIAALHPGLWGWNKMVMSEPTAVIAILLLMWAALVCIESSSRKQLTLGKISILGIASGFAALARAELLLLGAAVILVVLVKRNLRWSIRTVSSGGLIMLITLLPWIIFNLSRFEETVLLSNGAQITFAATNCAETYGGQFQAYWSMNCSVRAEKIAQERNPDADQSVIMNDIGQQAIDYVKDHKVTAAKTVVLRLGRVLGVYRPIQQINFDHFPEGRDLYVAIMAWSMYYLLLPFSILGGFLLRSRRRELLVMLLPIAVALFTVAITFGNTRYRLSAEPSMIILASFGLTQVWNFGYDRWTSRSDVKVQAS